MRKLGVIGGLGPMATALFMEMVIEMTQACTDQEHIEMIVYNCPQIPDRTKYILGESQENPVPQIIEIGKKLKEQGVDIIAIPCVTANYFYQDIRNSVEVEIIDIIREVGVYLREHHVQHVGLMATTGTIRSLLFQQVLETYGCKVVVPSEERQEDVMHIIYENVKKNQSVDMDRFTKTSDELRENGAEVILLGCTELSVVRDQYFIGEGYLDVMQLMAKCAVESCGNLREEYKELITKHEV